MKTDFLSLLYPDEASLNRHVAGQDRPRISEEVCRELGMEDFFTLKNGAVSDFFTMDEAVIRYRQETLSDLRRHPELMKTLGQALPILCDIQELRQLGEESGTASSGESYLYSITEIELYISCVDVLYRGLQALEGKLESPAFRSLCALVFRLAQSEYFRELNEKLEQLSHRIHEVRSITVGVNLDAQLRPSEAGIISINAQPFKSGKILDKILRMSFRNDAFTCIASLSPFGKGQSDNRREALMSAFNSAIEEVFRSSVRQWRNIVGEYVLDNTDFLLKILPEIEFVTRATELSERLRAKGCVLCTPTLRPMAEKSMEVRGLYNPAVAVKIADPVVLNDFSFDQNGRIYVLSGPNRGGKSVITCAVGLCQALAQLGMEVPAESAVLSPVDGIFTHFPTGADDTIDKGRLGEECARLREIFDSITENSLVLLDESLSSTGAYEASYIAAELIAGFAVARCRGIFSTHLHELAAKMEEINRRSAEAGGVKVDTLVAGMEEGQRSFRIVRTKPDGKSYARDIADKYGLSFENLQEKLAKK